MPYEIPVSSDPVGLFRDVNVMAGNNIPALSMLIILFTIAFMGGMGAGKRLEVSFAFASWITALSSMFMTVIFDLSAGFVIVPFVMACVSLLIVKALQP